MTGERHPGRSAFHSLSLAMRSRIRMMDKFSPCVLSIQKVTFMRQQRESSVYLKRAFYPFLEERALWLQCNPQPLFNFNLELVKALFQYGQPRRMGIVGPSVHDEQFVVLFCPVMKKRTGNGKRTPRKMAKKGGCSVSQLTNCDTGITKK